MIVRVYDFLSVKKPKFSQNLVGIVSDVENFKYTRRAYDIGSFEMTIPTHADEAGCIQPDRMLIVGEKLGQTYIASDPTKRIVRGTFLYVTDIEKKDDKITVTGYDLKYLFALRVTLFPKEEQDKGTYGYYVTSGTTFSCISDIVNYNIVNASDSDRQIYGMFGITMPVNQINADPPLTGIQDDRYMTRLEPVSTAIFNLLKNCKTHFYDMRLIIDDNAEDSDNYNPHMESSEDKPVIIIDESRYNIKSYTRKDGTSAYKNAIYAVVGSGDDVTVKCVKRPDDTASGVKRKEVVLDVDTDSVAEIDRYALKAAEEYVISDDFEIEPLFMDDETEPELAQKVSIRIDGVEYETVITEITDEYANGKHTQSYACGDKKLKVLNVLNKATAGNTQKIINNKITTGNAGGVGKFTNTDRNCEVFNDYENNVASSYYAHAEGYKTTANAPYAHAEGYATTASAPSAHAEGEGTAASQNAHSEGVDTKATGYASHAEGKGTVASGWVSHSEGCETEARGLYSHAEGENCKAIGSNSHAGGMYSEALSEYSFAHGYGAKSSWTSGTALGRRNKTQNTLFVIGNGGWQEGSESDALTLDENGMLWIEGSFEASAKHGGLGIAIHGAARFGNNWNSDGTNILLAVGNGYDSERTSDALVLDSNGNLWVAGSIKCGGDSGGYTLPPATADTLGGVMIGENINVSDSGTISVDLSEYLKTGDISDWAKADSKPTYTAEEIGAVTPYELDSKDYLKATEITGQTVNLDDIKLNESSDKSKSKRYFCASVSAQNIENRPISANEPFELSVDNIRNINTGAFNTMQRYTSVARKRTYTRWCNDGAWSAWKCDTDVVVYGSVTEDNPKTFAYTTYGEGFSVVEIEAYYDNALNPVRNRKVFALSPTASIERVMLTIGNGSSESVTLDNGSVTMSMTGTTALSFMIRYTNSR